MTGRKKPDLPINLNEASLDDLKFIFSDKIATNIFNLTNKKAKLEIKDLIKINHVTKEKLYNLVLDNKIKF